MRELIYPKGTPIYLYPRLSAWDNFTMDETGEPLKVGNLRAQGVVLVYDNLEDYHADHPDMEPVVVYSQGEPGVPSDTHANTATHAEGEGR